MRSNGRLSFANAVRAATKGNPGAVLYGSFSTDTFHYDRANHHSLSDVDLVLPESTQTTRLCAARGLQEDILRLTGLQLCVSVRGTRIHDNRIPHGVAPIVGFFELLARVDHFQTDQWREYLMAKFLLRALAPSQFFENPNGAGPEDNMLLDTSEYHELMRIKRGSERRAALNWNSLICRIPSPRISSVARELWVVGEIAKPPSRLLREFRAAFTGIDVLYADLCRKLSTIGSEST